MASAWRTLQLPDIAALRERLTPEWPVSYTLLEGRSKPRRHAAHQCSYASCAGSAVRLRSPVETAMLHGFQQDGFRRGHRGFHHNNFTCRNVSATDCLQVIYKCSSNVHHAVWQSDSSPKPFASDVSAALVIAITAMLCANFSNIAASLESGLGILGPEQRPNDVGFF